jgi:hypothetical protein
MPQGGLQPPRVVLPTLRRRSAALTIEEANLAC